MRYLGIDIGKRAIGVAIGEMLASELTTLRCSKEESFYEGVAMKRAFDELAKLIELEQADAVVVGLPVDEEGNPTQESEQIEKFCQKFEDEKNVSIHFVDETLTSFMAEEILESQGVDKKEAEEREHQLAAQLILQQYFEENEIA